MNKKVTKAIIPAAGLGTRFLPQTKAMPKEMLPILDKPLIQLIVEELVEVGVTDVIIVTGPQKRAIEDHFDRSIELEQALTEKGKLESVKVIKDIAEMANFIYLRQKGEPKGNARPVINASHLLNDDEAFFVLFPDDFFACERKSSARQMLDAYQQNGSDSPVLSLIKSTKEDISKYGAIEVSSELSDSVVEVKSIIEKPAKGEEPSLLASVSGYLLTGSIISYIEKLQPDASGEVAIAHALQEYAKDHRVLGVEIDGKYFDCGNKVGYFEALLHAGSQDPDIQHSS
jgi:UTP--glucose-1-phosphate uridylyltransferase